MQTKLETPCQLMARLIRLSEKEIKEKEKLIHNMKESLNKLQGQKNPDKAKLDKIKNDIQKLEDELKMDRDQLDALKEEFKASCGS